MALTPERYEAVDAELDRIHNFLVALATELDVSQQRLTFAFTVTALNFVAAQVGYVRRLLELAQKKSQKGRHKFPDLPPS